MGKDDVKHVVCLCGKRAFFTRRDAEKALGRTQHKRRSRFDKHGTRRGLEVENRYYECDQVEEQVFHLTHMNRRDVIAA